MCGADEDGAMSDEDFNRALAEIAESIKELDSRGCETSLPEYTVYGGLRVLESSSGDAASAGQIASKQEAAA